MILVSKEHETLSGIEALADAADELRLRLDNAFKNQSPEFLGVNGCFQAGYYVGSVWLEQPADGKDGVAIQVLPKIDEVDYVKMFMTALDVDSSDEAEYFSDYYHIDFDAPLIEIKARENLLTPLLLLHYVSLLKQLVKGGLRKGYVRREGNLQSKIRGKIMFAKHLKQNVFCECEDRIYCAYQEYTIDTPENRLLKKALSTAKDAMMSWRSFENEEIDRAVISLECAFSGVSDDFSLAQVGTMKSSKLFRHYAEATRVAKMILQYLDCGLDSANEETQCICPFRIDMARLYEMYVYHKLAEAYPNEIMFQVKGRHKTQVDYIRKGTEEKIILDAKYKPRYEHGNAGIIADVREISGYARDTKILNELGWGNASQDGREGKLLPDCVIIYPVVQVEENDDGEKNNVVTENDCKKSGGFHVDKKIVDQCDPIRAFEGFYKIAISLPTKEPKA